jgi:hypothetical protein
MKTILSHPWRTAVATVAAAAAAAFGGGALPSAEAAVTCGVGVPTTVAPTAGATAWDVEGKITGFDTTARTITANGMTFHVPDTMKIKTNGLDQPDGNLEFTGPGSLTDPALEAKQSIVGGTVIASGNVVTTPTTGGFCLTFEPTSIFVELAENGVIGPLVSVDAANGTFNVNGATVKMNDDPRVPSKLTDLAGQPLTLDQLANNIGMLMDVGGYFDTAANTLRGTIVEADLVAPKATTDTVSIDQAQWASQELRGRGVVSRKPDGQYAASVSLFTGAANGTTCGGTRLATAAINATDGSYTFRMRNVANPGTICVSSLGGGVDDSPVTAK